VATPVKRSTGRTLLVVGVAVVGVLVVLVAAVTLLGKNAPPWATFAPDGGDFSVSMPGEPKVDVVQKTVAGRSIDINVASSQQRTAEHATYWYDVPVSLVGFNAQDLLESESQGVFGGIGATVTTTTPTTVDGRPALRVTGRLDKNNEDLQALLILNGNRVHLFVAGESTTGAAENDRFFESIRFTA
jgi:hypothetical protein